MRAAALLVLGLFFGFTAAMIQTHTLGTAGSVRLPTVTRARSQLCWSPGRRLVGRGPACARDLLGRWLAATLMMGSETGAGDLILTTGTRQMAYLVGGTILLAAACGYPLLPQDDTPEKLTDALSRPPMPSSRRRPRRAGPRRAGRRPRRATAGGSAFDALTSERFRRATSRYATGIAVATTVADGDHADDRATRSPRSPWIRCSPWCVVERDSRFHSAVMAAGVWVGVLPPRGSGGGGALVRQRGRPLAGQSTRCPRAAVPTAASCWPIAGCLGAWHGAGACRRGPRRAHLRGDRGARGHRRWPAVVFFGSRSAWPDPEHCRLRPTMDQ